MTVSFVLLSFPQPLVFSLCPDSKKYYVPVVGMIRSALTMPQDNTMMTDAVVSGCGKCDEPPAKALAGQGEAEKENKKDVEVVVIDLDGTMTVWGVGGWGGKWSGGWRGGWRGDRRVKFGLYLD